MDLTQITNAGSRLFGRSGLAVRKVSPELMVGAGIVGLVAAGVLVARATMKAGPRLQETREALESVDVLSRTDITYIEHGDRAKDLRHIYTTTTLDMVKLYAPAVSLAGLGVVCVLGGHHILKQRNVALAAAYKALEASYGEYRKRVRQAVGKSRELEIYQDVREIEVEDDKGKTVKKKVHGPNAGNGYGRFFDQLNVNYVENASLNLAFITSVQRYFNMQLNIRGYVFLNEVYKALGMEETTAGQVVGWISDRSNRPEDDGWIDFGIDDPDNFLAQRFIRGEERAVFLDFNVDGDIHSRAFAAE